MPFQVATKRAAKLRLALIGPSGSGKTYTALRIATALGGRIALLDTERGSASKYSDEFRFDAMELDSFHPQRYIDAIHEAEAAGYDVLIVDSLSHAWMGKDGALELVDRAAKRQGGNKFTAWGDVTPLQQQLVDAMIGAKLHLIATVRSKMEYVQEKDDRGKTTIRKVGMQPVQRDGIEYEFDLVGDLDQSNTLVVSKSRCSALSGAVIEKPGPEIAATLRNWLSGEAAAPAASANAQAQSQRAASPQGASGTPAAQASAPNGHAQASNGKTAPAPTADGWWTIRVDGQEIRVPESFKDLPATDLTLYRAWVIQSNTARTFGELGAYWTKIEPEAAVMGDHVLKQIKGVFTWRKEQLMKARAVPQPAQPEPAEMSEAPDDAA